MTGFDAAKAFGEQVDAIKAALAAQKPKDPPPRDGRDRKASNMRYAGPPAGFREYLRKEMEK